MRPSLGDTRFDVRSQFSNPERTKELLLNNDISSVIYGVKSAVISDLKLTETEYSDIRYALVVMKAMLGKNVKLLNLADGRTVV